GHRARSGAPAPAARSPWKPPDLARGAEVSRPEWRPDTPRSPNGARGSGARRDHPKRGRSRRRRQANTPPTGGEALDVDPTAWFVVAITPNSPRSQPSRVGCPGFSVTLQ